MSSYKSDLLECLIISLSLQPDIAPSQLFAYTFDNVLRTERSCATIDDRRSTKYIVMIPCNSDDEVNDSWILTADRQLKHEQTGLCIGKKFKSVVI